MRALLAMWRVSLRRTVADWPIVAAAWLITLLAATLLAGATMYPSAAAQAGLRRALADAPADQSVLEVARYTPAGQTSAADAVVRAELDRLLGGVGGSVVRDWRSTSTAGLPVRGQSEDGDQVILGSLDGLPEHATLVEGTWPATGTAPDGPMEVVVIEAVARELDLHVGDVVPLDAYFLATPAELPVRIAGIASIDRAADPFWGGDEQLLTGIHASPRYRTFGPFFATADALLASPVGALRQRWRVSLRFEDMAVEQAGPLRDRLAALPGRLAQAGGAGYEVHSGLGTILGQVERSLLVSRTGVLLLIAQLLLLGAYAIVLTASLLVDHRRVDTALLRSRGAGALEVAALALVEGVVLAVPAVLLAPWLAVGSLQLLNAAGPLAEVGISIVPRVTADTYLAAAAAGLGCVALLVLPAFLAARSFAAEHADLSRQETRTFGHRMGLDVALLALTGVAIWQLRLYGAPLTRTVQGSLGIDPLLVAAPTIGMIAGGVLALRVLPRLAGGVERVFTRGRDLVLSLGSRQLARRPLRYTRSALLLMLAMSMGVFGLSYASTWSTSQRDQAAYQAGADVRVVDDPADNGSADWTLPHAYASLAGVETLSPVERIASRVPFASAGSSDLLAMDAATAPAVVLARADETPVPLDALFAPLRDGRPDPELIDLAPDAAFLRVEPALDRASFGRLSFNPDTGESDFHPLEPGETVDVRMRAAAVVRDGHGLLHRFETEAVRLGDVASTMVLPLGQPGDATGAARLDGPISVAAVTVELWLPDGLAAGSAGLGVAGLASSAAQDGPWDDVALDGPGWQARLSRAARAFVNVPMAPEPAAGMVLAGGGEAGLVFGDSRRAAAAAVFLAGSLAPEGEGVPVLANRAFLKATSTEPGETVTARLEGAARRIVIAGVVDAFPTTDPRRPLLIFDEPTLAMLRLDAGANVRSPDEWWLGVADGADDAVTTALRAAPFEGATVVGLRDRAQSLSRDPVALGVIAALTLGFVVTGLFAVVGLVVSGAVSARQRRTEFALLRALGLSGRQLFGSLWLENGSVVIVSLAAGTALGLLMGWIALPFITVTQAAAAPIPPVIVEVPWGRILGLEVVSAAALAIAVVVIGGVLRRLGVGSVLRMGED